MTSTWHGPASQARESEADNSVFEQERSTTAAHQQPFFLTFGVGINRPVGNLLVLQPDETPVETLRDVLESELPDGEEVWFALNRWTPNYRKHLYWEAACGIALDVDIELPDGTRPDRGAVSTDDAIEAAKRGQIHGNLIYSTGRGIRVVFLFKKVVVDRDAFLACGIGAASLVEQDLSAAGLSRYKIDSGALSRLTNQPAYAPCTVVEGERRKADVQVVRTAPYDALELSQSAPPLPSRIDRVGRRGSDRSSGHSKESEDAGRGSNRDPESDFELAVEAWNHDHQIDWFEQGRTCPTCGHHDCFNGLPDDPEKWFCWSSNHEADSDGCGIEVWFGWVGDALDIASHERGITAIEVLQEDGYLPPEKGRVVDIPREQVENLLCERTGSSPMGVEEAREKVAEEVNRIIDSDGSGTVVFELPPGAGKTITTLKEIQDRIIDGTLKGRVLYLTDTHEQLLGLEDDEKLLPLWDHSVIRFGRTDDPNSPGFCRELVEERKCERFRRARQELMSAFCKAGRNGCPHSASCDYLSNVDEAKGAQVVFTTKALLRAQPRFAEGFEVVIIDESLDDLLTEEVTISREHVDEWCKSARRLLFREKGDPAARIRVVRFLEIVMRVISGEWDRGSGPIPLLPLLDQVEGFTRLLEEVAEDTRGHADRLPLEKPYVSRDGLVVPLVALKALVEALGEEVGGERGREGNVRLGHNGIEFVRRREAVIEVLKNKKVINLDATPNWTMIEMVLGGVERRDFGVAQNRHVTQIHDRLLVGVDIANQTPRLNRLLNELLKDAENPVILLPKRFNPNVGEHEAEKKGLKECEKWKRERQARIDAGEVIWIEGNDRVKYAHFGGSSRGVDHFKSASVIVVLGHHSHNVESVERLVQVARADWLGSRVQSGWKKVPYLTKNSDTVSKARWVKQHQDHDVDRILQHSREANILQSIGRGRACLRSPEAPLRVLLLAAHPISGLPIDQLTTLEQLEREAGIGIESNSNEARHSKFESEVKKAAESLQSRGEEVNPLRVAREMGGGTGGSRRNRTKKALLNLGFLK